MHATRTNKRLTGASLIELLVLIILILIFITLAISRIWELRVSAERVGVEQMVGTLKSALGIELASSVTKYATQLELAKYDHCNPMRFLANPPDNYLGEFATGPENPVPGTWYFDRLDATLNYRFRFRNDFVSSNPDDPELIRFQVRLDYQDLNHNGRFDPATESASALTLVALDKYRRLSENGPNS